jgi:hypothetical protein
MYKKFSVFIVWGMVEKENIGKSQKKSQNPRKNPQILKQ